MKKNKGYTLVELLVAMVVLVIVLMEVYMVMNSGSKVYEHGSIDVALQTEAQQAILELEDLIIDVNSDIIYTPQSLTVSENGSLKIVNHDDTYVIRYDGSDSDRSSLGYGTLKYRHDIGSSSGNEIPLSDYVQLFYVDTSKIQNHTGDSVVLSIKMNNGTYSYEASKEVFLRNKLGTGGVHPAPPAAAFDYDLVALRYKDSDYNLSNMGFECDHDPCTYFVWEDTSGSSFTTDTEDPSSFYEITANKFLKVNSIKCKDWSATGSARVWGFKDAATATSNPSKHCVIQVSTDSVGCGSKDEAESLAYFNWYNASSVSEVCMTQVYGIDVNSAIKAHYYMEYSPKGAHINAATEGTVLKKDGTGSEIKVEDVTSGGQSGVDADDITASVNPIFQANLISADMKVYPDNDDSLPYSLLRGTATYVFMDATLNTFCTYGEVNWTDTHLADFDSKNQKLFGYCDIEFPDSHHLKFPIYPLLVGDSDAENLKPILFNWAEIDSYP